jgi:hypothetical protein
MYRTRLDRRSKLIALAVLFAVAGCGDEDGAAPPARTAPPASPAVARIAELETRIAEYCEIRSSGSATAADRARAVAATDALIRLARRRAAARDALERASVVIEVDCRDPALQRRVDRALR